MRLIDADKLIYQSHAQHLEPYINKKDIDDAPTIEMAEDCISREEAINELKLAYFNKDLQSAKDDPCIVDAMTDWAIRTIKNLPSVQPQPKKGEWIFNENMHDYCCSECGCLMPNVNEYYRKKIIGCPYCLADMRESEDEG